MYVVSYVVLRQIFSEPWDMLVVCAGTGLASQPGISRAVLNAKAVHSMEVK